MNNHHGLVADLPILNHAQFAAKAVTNGGASRGLSDQREGPSHGYYVSRSPDEGHEMETNRAPNAVDAAAHLAATTIRRGEPGGPEVYQGVWHDHESGQTYYDVSDRYKFLNQAGQAARASNQVALYDAKRGASAYLNPVFNKRQFTPTDTSPTPAGELQYRASKQGTGWSYR